MPFWSRPLGVSKDPSLAWRPIKFIGHRSSNLGSLHVLGGRYGDFQSVGLDKPNGSPPYTGCRFEVDPLGSPKTSSLAWRPTKSFGHRPSNLGSLHVLGGRYGDFQSVGLDKPNGSPPYTGCRDEVDPLGSPKTPSLAWRPTKFFGHRPSNLGSLHVLGGRYGDFQSVGLDKPNGSPPYTVCRFELDPLGSPNTPSLAWRPIKFFGHRPSNLGSLHVLGGRYGDFQSVGLDKPNGSPPYTGCRFEVDPLGSPKTPSLAWRPIKFIGHRSSNLGSLHVLGGRYGDFQSVGLDKPNGSPPYTGCRFEVDPLGSPKTPSLAWRPIKFFGHRPSNLGSLHVLGGRYGDFQSVGLDKPNGSPPYTGCHSEVDPLGSPKTPSLAWRPTKFFGHRPSNLGSLHVLGGRNGDFQNVGLDKPNGSPPYTGCRFEVDPLGSPKTPSLAWRPIKFFGHRPSNLDSLHVLGGRYGDFQSVGLDKPNGSPPYTGRRFEVDPLGSPKTPSLAWRPIKFIGHRSSNLGSLHVLGGRYGDFQSVGLDKPNGSPPYTGCRFEVDPLGSPKTPSLAWRHIKFFGHRPSNLGFLHVLGGRYGDFQSVGLDKPNGSPPYTGCRFEVDPLGSPKTPSLAIKFFGHRPSNLGSLHVLGGRYGDFQSIGLDKPNGSPPYTGCRSEVDPSGSPKTPSLAWRPIKFFGHRPSNLGSLHVLGGRCGDFQSVGLDKPNGSPPYTGRRFEVDPLGSPKTPSLAWRLIKFFGHRPSNLGSLHVLGGRYGDFQSVGLDKPNGSPPYTGCRFGVDPLGSPKTPSLAWRPIKFFGHRPSNLGSLHVFGGRYGDFQSVGLDKPNGSPPYTGCRFEVDPLGSPKTPSLAWRPIKFFGHRPSNLGSLHVLGGRYGDFQSVGLDKPNGSPPYTGCRFEVDPWGSPKTPSLAWRPIKFFGHRPSNLGSLHVLGGRCGDFQSVGLDKPNGSPPYTGCRSEVDPLGSPKTPSLAWRPIKFFGHRPSNLGSLHVLGGRYGDFQSVGLDKPNGSPPYTWCRSEVHPLGSPKTPSLAWRPIKFFGHRPSNLGSLHVLGGRYGDFQSVGLDKPNGSPPYTGCRFEVDPLGSPKTPSLAWRPIKFFGHRPSNLGSLHVLGGRYGDFQSVGLDKPNGSPPYTGCRSEVDPWGSPKTPSLAWRPIKFFGHRPSNLGSLHVLGGRYGDFQSVGLDKPNGSPPYTGCRSEVDPLGSPKTPSLAWRPIKFFGHRPSNLGSLHVLGGRYGDFQSVGLDKPNGSPPYTGCRFEVDPLGSPKTPSLAWRPIKFFGHRPSNLGSLHVLGGRYGDFQSVGLDKPNGSPPYTWCRSEVDPLGSPKTPSLAWRPIKFFGHRPSNLGSLHVLGGRYGDFQSVGLDKPNGSPPYTGCRFEVDPLGSPKTPSLAWRPIKFFGHRPSNLGSLHVLGGRYGDFQSVGLDKPNGSPPYTGCRSEVDPLGSPKTPSLAWRPIKFFGHRPSNLGSLHVLGGRYGDFQSVGLDKPNGSPPYTGCRFEVDPLGSPKTPSLAWRPIKFFGHRPSNLGSLHVLGGRYGDFQSVGLDKPNGSPPYTGCRSEVDPRWGLLMGRQAKLGVKPQGVYPTQYRVATH